MTAYLFDAGIIAQEFSYVKYFQEKYVVFFKFIKIDAILGLLLVNLFSFIYNFLYILQKDC